MHTAVAKGLTDIAVLLITNGINVNVQDEKGQTSLHYAAAYDQLDLAKILLENGGKLSVEDMFGNQPLWTAVFNDKGRNSRREMVALFVENRADTDHKNKAGKSPKDIITIAGYNNLKPFMKM